MKCSELGKYIETGLKNFLKQIKDICNISITSVRNKDERQLGFLTGSGKE